MKAAVVALGKIGLPLAVQFAKSGVRTYGADIAAEAVSKIAQGIPPFPGEAHLEEYLNEVLAKGMLSVGTDTVEAVSQAGIVVVVVPLLVDGDGVPSFGAMDAATRDIALGLRPGTMVVYETTLPFGATRDRFEPMLAEFSGLDATEFMVPIHLSVFTAVAFSKISRPIRNSWAERRLLLVASNFTRQFSHLIIARTLTDRMEFGTLARRRRPSLPSWRARRTAM